MDFTFELSKIFNALPFEILKQDKDAVIMLINYFIVKGESAGTKTANNGKIGGKEERIKVNDKTATGGWW